MSRIKFITDSASDMPRDFAKEHNIDILPFHIYFRDSGIESEEYLDGVNITNDELFEKMQTGKGNPNTSQVTSFEIEEYLRSIVAKNEYDTYIFTCISSKGSPTYNNVLIAKKAMNDDGIDFDLRVIDSEFYTISYYYAIKAGIRAYNDGKTADEIVEIISQKCKNTDIYLSCETLEYLKRGGRITGASVLVGTLLDIKPILTVRDGLVAPFDKVRGMKKVMQKIVEIVKEKTKDGKYDFYIVYSTKTESLSAFIEIVKEEFNLDDINIHQVGATIGVHIGPGLIGLMFQKKVPFAT
jgi:DegV family protein with EDD domain